MVLLLKIPFRPIFFSKMNPFFNSLSRQYREIQYNFNISVSEDQLSGILVKRDFKYHIFSTNDLSSKFQLLFSLRCTICFHIEEGGETARGILRSYPLVVADRPILFALPSSSCATPSAITNTHPVNPPLFQNTPI